MPGDGARPIATHTALLPSGHPSRRRLRRGIEGMVTSTSGLASAKTVSDLGGIYCSSPVWSVTVIEEMGRISEYAR